MRRVNSLNTENAENSAEEMCQVVVNDEEQYSIWPLDRELPAGWRPEGRQGTRQECLAHVDEVWTDMRPLSLRRRMDDAAEASGATA
jgi:MbtH protein